MTASGGATVGLLSDLDALDMGAVLCLRFWCDGGSLRDRVACDFGMALGIGAGRHATESFATLIEIIQAHGRRPLMRHSTSCPCVGADEACFARLICCAAQGDREDAMLIASLMVRPDMAPAVAALAEEVALAVARISAPPTRLH